MAALAEVRGCGVWSLSLNFRLVVSQISVGDIRFHQALSYLVVLWRCFMPPLWPVAHTMPVMPVAKTSPLLFKFTCSQYSAILFCTFLLPPFARTVYFHKSIHMHMVKQASSVGQIKRWRARNHPPMCQPSHRVPLFDIAHIWLQLHKNRWHECDHTLSLTLYT